MYTYGILGADHGKSVTTKIKVVAPDGVGTKT